MTVDIYTVAKWKNSDEQSYDKAKYSPTQIPTIQNVK